jgi:predicted nucleic acid-binding protein
MVAGLNQYYWDACIFYEHLKDEQADPNKKKAVSTLIADNKAMRNRIFTSVFTHNEVFPKKLGNAEQRYWDAFSSMFFFDVDVDRQTLLLAREIRDFYYQEGDGATRKAKVLSTGDSIHLATAIVHEATELHTRDANRRNGNIPLLGLDASSPDGKICGKYALKIVSPIAPQGELDV